jgi:hypothetical protein
VLLRRKVSHTPGCGVRGGGDARTG